MNTTVLDGKPSEFFTRLLAQYQVGEVTSVHVMRYVVALFICGRSGAGKDTLRRHLLENEPLFGRVITTTTRPPEERNGRMEVDGVDYYFVTREKFDTLWTEGGLLERDTFAGNCYGCSLAGVLSVLASGRIPILQITFEGVDLILPKLGGNRGRGIFITAPRDVVEARIRQRAVLSGKPLDEKSLIERLVEGDEEESLYRQRFVEPFGTVMINEELSAAQGEILRLARSDMGVLRTACELAIVH